MVLDKKSPVPLHAQILRQIELAIARGDYKPGDRLPTVRELAVELKVNSNTVARVYLQLEATGILTTRRGLGSFVKNRPAASRHVEQAELERLCRDFVEQCFRQGFDLRAVRRTLAALSKKGAGS